jgi:hypothetical protein
MASCISQNSIQSHTRSLPVMAVVSAIFCLRSGGGRTEHGKTGGIVISLLLGLKSLHPGGRLCQELLPAWCFERERVSMARIWMKEVEGGNLKESEPRFNVLYRVTWLKPSTSCLLHGQDVVIGSFMSVEDCYSSISELS